MNTQQFMAVVARKRAESITPTEAFAKTLTADGFNFNGWNIRSIIDASYLSSAGTQIRATIEAATTEGASFASIYIGHQASSGNNYDFDGNQVQLLFGGSGAVLVSAGSEETSDFISFAYDNSKNLILSLGYAADAANDGNRQDYNVGNTGLIMRRQSGAAAQAGATTPSGTYDNIIDTVNSVNLIEVQ